MSFDPRQRSLFPFNAKRRETSVSRGSKSDIFSEIDTFVFLKKIDYYLFKAFALKSELRVQ